MSLKDLAQQAGVNTGDKVEEPKKTVGDLAGKKEEAKKERKPRVIVDDAWIEGLTERAQEKFGNQEKFSNAKVEFTVAKSKGRFVSLTPKLAYEDGMIKSAGPKNRVGFCTNEKWDIWFEKLEKALEAAHAAERKAPKARKASGQWASFATSVKDTMGDEVSIKTVSKKLTIKDTEGNRVTLKREGDEALVGSAVGDPKFVSEVLKSVKDVSFEETEQAKAA